MRSHEIRTAFLFVGFMKLKWLQNQSIVILSNSRLGGRSSLILQGLLVECDHTHSLQTPVEASICCRSGAEL